jgi:hypothetical protein
MSERRGEGKHAQKSIGCGELGQNPEIGEILAVANREIKSAAK